MNEPSAEDGSIAPSHAESSLARELLIGAVGALIALGCFLPPLVHLVSGPFGPLIGALVVSQRWRPSVRGRATIALTIGSVLTGIAGGVAAAVRASSGGAPSWFPATDALATILVGIWVWGAGLAAVGVAISVHLRKPT